MEDGGANINGTFRSHLSFFSCSPVSTKVLVDVKLQGAESAIAVCPRKDARLRVNREVISALVDGGGGND